MKDWEWTETVSLGDTLYILGGYFEVTNPVPYTFNAPVQIGKSRKDMHPRKKKKDNQE